MKLLQNRGTALLLVTAACSSSEPEPTAASAPPWDDDAPRLAHCTFEPAPVRSSRPAEEPSPIRAGIGSAILRMPIGTPLGGYGARVKLLGGMTVDARAARWATGMVPTVGVHDAPRVEALALEAGEERLVIVRMDAPLVTENALFDLERALAPDGSMRGRVLVTASHSHAAWAAWQPTLFLMPGTDRPRRELLDRVVEAMRQAAQEALDALEPARLGFAVEPAFDPDGLVTKDRRDENDDILGPDGNTAGRGKDPVAWAMRVDRDGGSPLVAIVGFPVHGTIGSDQNQLASTDVIGAVERSVSHALGHPVFHVQGPAGDVTPVEPQGRAACPDATRCLDMPTLEMVGALAAAQLAPLVASVDTDAEAALEIVTRTFPIGRGGVVERPDGKQLWYLPPDPAYVADGVLLDPDGTAKIPFDEFNALAGAGQCGNAEQGSLSPIPGAEGPYASCIDVETGAGLVVGIFGVDEPAVPLCDSVRATAAALRVSGLASGDWMMLGLPGEASAPFAHYLRGRSPAGPERTLLVGYANEYAGYLLTSEDWLAGGYECSTNLWGPREGEQIIDGILEAAAIASTQEREDPEAGTSRFEDFAWIDESAVAATITTDHGTPFGGSLDSLYWPDAVSVGPTAATVARGIGVVRFAWNGGDPAVDFPEVVVERELAADRFELLADEHGRAQSSFAGVVVITYTPDPIEAAAPERHVYAATWQPVAPGPFVLDDAARPFSLPTGRYRLRATGQARSTGGVEAYEATSTPVEIVDAPLGTGSSATRVAGGIEIVAILGGAPGMRALRVGPSDQNVPLAGPWSATVTKSDMTTLTLVVTPTADGKGKAALPALDAAAAVDIDVRDASGNGGTLAVR